MHALGFVWCNMVHMTNWVLNGIPERFPKLKSIWIESGLAWVPFLMQRLDDQYLMRQSEAPLLKQLPSEYMRRNCWYTSQPMETTHPRALEVTLEMINAETQLLFSSDWPHFDFDLPATIYDLPFLSSRPSATSSASTRRECSISTRRRGRSSDAGIFPNGKGESVVMAGLVAAIHVLLLCNRKRRAGGSQSFGFWARAGIAAPAARATPPIIGFALAQPRSWFFTGSTRMRLPVAAKIALHSAGATGGTGGSPTPPRIRRSDDHGFDLRRVGDAQHLVGVEVFLLGTPSLIVISPLSAAVRRRRRRPAPASRSTAD